MKAIIYSTYGGPEVLKVQDIVKPYPKTDEILVKVRSVSVNYGDILARTFKYISPGAFNMPLLFWLLARISFGWNKPAKKILGNTFSGEIEAVGDAVKQFKKGDAVFGYVGENMGAYTEYLCMPESGIVAPKPSKMTFDEAACIPYGALMAWCLLKKVKIQAGQRTLVLGASGAIGSAAVQLVKNNYGAEVTGVCSAASAGYVKRIGADKVIDYQKEDFTKNGEQYDLIIDILGKGVFSAYKPSLTSNGVYFSVSFKLRKLLQMFWTSMTGGKKVLCALANPAQQDLYLIKELVDAGKFKAVIDKIFPFEQAAEAHRYAESGHKNGHVVITLTSL